MTPPSAAPAAHAEPLAPGERLFTLDLVRGFALLGILIMNMPGFSASFFIEADGSHLWPGQFDQFAELVRDMLFSGKFNSMFSLLFGLGFTIQLGRLQARDPAGATGIYLRRLVVLLGFGLLHTMVFWTGDVLHVYAVLGLLLLALRRVPDRVIIGLIGMFLLYPIASGTLRLLVMTPDVVSGQVALAQAWEASNNLAYGHGSFIDAAREHSRESAYYYSDRYALWISLGFYVQMCTTMLLGFLIGRNGWYRQIPALMPRIRTLQWTALAVGIVCALFFGIVGEMNRAPGPSPIKMLVWLAYAWARLSMMIFYVLTLVRAAEDPRWRARLAPVAVAGRMPLTNYLMQTLICTTLFYGWGFGLWGKVGPAAGLLLAFAIFFVVQVPLSRAWLSRHDMGPLEWVWRRATYGRIRGAGAPWCEHDALSGVHRRSSGELSSSARNRSDHA